MNLVGYQVEVICGFSLGSIEVEQYDDSTYVLVEFLVFRLLLEFK